MTDNRGPDTVFSAGPEVPSNQRTMAALSYIFPFIGSALTLLSENHKHVPFQRFHAIQGLGLGVAYIVYEILAHILGAILSGLSGGLLCCVTSLLPLLIAVPALYYGYQAYQGRVFEVPYLTEFMVQQGWLQRL